MLAGPVRRLPPNCSLSHSAAGCLKEDGGKVRQTIIAAAMLALTVSEFFPSAVSADEHRGIEAVPVLIDFDDYNPAHETLENAIDDGLLKSARVTPKVDADRALKIKVRLLRATDKRQLAEVTYSWDRTIISRKTYPCSRSQIRPCSAAIVSGAEQASHTVRRSSSWPR